MKGTVLKHRPINSSDLPDILKINNQVQLNPWTQADIEVEISKQCNFSKAALKEDKLVGYLLVRECGKDLEIMSIGVDQKHQRSGIGSALLKELIQSKPPSTELFLEVSHENQPAQAIYLRMGFETYLVRKSYYGDGSNALCMKLRLANP